MASTLTTGAVATGVQPRADIGVHSVSSTYTIAAAFVVNDVIQMVKIPKGATINEVILNTTDLDTSTGVVLAVGDGNDVDRFIKDSAIGQTGGTARLGAGIVDNAGNNYTYTADDTIDVKVTTAATGTAATTGTVGLTVIYTMQQTVV